MAEGISVRPVKTGSELNTFIKLSWKYNQKDPNWVPPMLFDLKRRLDRKHHPFFRHAEAELFLAFRGHEPVGRITAHWDKHHDEAWGPGCGHFGFYESENNPEAAKALFAAAIAWHKARGRSSLRGPLNFSVNDEIGLLVGGFDTPTMMLMPHNPPYYAALFEGQGLKKVQDLYSYRLDATVDPPADVAAYAAKIRAREDVVIRQWDPKNFSREMDLWLEVYNEAWEKNWGAVKMTEAEFKAHALDLKFLMDPRLIFFAETRQGEVMGCAFTLPNLNEYLGPANGHLYGLLPFGWYGLLVSKKYQSCRVVTLGTKEKFRRSGVGAVFYYETLMAAKRLGYQWGDLGWILESNDAMNRAIQHMGGKVYKTYRIYETAI